MKFSGQIPFLKKESTKPAQIKLKKTRKNFLFLSWACRAKFAHVSKRGKNRQIKIGGETPDNLETCDLVKKKKKKKKSKFIISSQGEFILSLRNKNHS